MHSLVTQRGFGIASRDKQLSRHEVMEIVERERDGIAQWIMGGLSQYRQNGWYLHPSVMASAEDYSKATPSIGNFVADRCGIGADKKVLRKEFLRELEEYFREQQ